MKTVRGVGFATLLALMLLAGSAPSWGQVCRRGTCYNCTGSTGCGDCPFEDICILDCDDGTSYLEFGPYCSCVR